MAVNNLEHARHDAMAAAGWLHNNFPRAPLDTRVYAGLLAQIRKCDGGYSVDPMCTDADRSVMAGLAGVSALGTGYHFPGKGRQAAQIQSGWLQTDHLLIAHARLAMMGFGDAGFTQLRESLAPYLSELRIRKVGVTVPYDLHKVLWFDDIRNRGDCFIAPTVDDIEHGFTMNRSNSHGLFVGDRKDGYVSMLFIPMSASLDDLQHLVEGAELTDVDRAAAMYAFRRAIVKKAVTA